MTRWTFRLLNLDTGAYLGDLVDYTQVTAGFEFSAVSSFSCQYPLTGRFASLLDTDLEIVGLFDGVEPKNARWVSRGLEGNTYDENGGKVTLAALGIMDLLRKVVMYASTTFAAQTCGAILKTVFQTATTRGAFGTSAITTSSFTNTTDSNGNAWAYTLNITYSPGANYRQILEQMVQLGLIDFEWNGRDLRVYNFGTMGVASPGTQTLSAGTHVTETPFKESTEDKANVILVEGDGGVLVERTVSGVRREESYAQQSGVSNGATLNVIGDRILAGLSVVQTMKTVKIAAGSSVLPFEDFIVGDYIIYDDGFNAAAANRTRQVALEVDNDGIDSYSVALNDLILENDIKRAIQLQSLAGGVSGATIGVPTSPPTIDTTIPSAPASCSITSATYLETDGQIRAQITVVWSAVTTNTDATAIGDLEHYEVQYFTASSPLIPPSQWSTSHVVESTVTTAYFGPFAPGSSVTARVRAVDSYGNAGAWTASSPTTVVSDTTPPVAPSTPVVVTQFRGIQVTWDGKDNLGNAMAGDFDHLDLHVSTTSGFTPTTGTKVDSIRTRGGVFSVQGLTYGTTYYAKLIAVDTSNNSSAASAQASATPQTLVSPDVPGLFITNAMIAALAVDDAKIATVSAGKITVGTLVADITLSARIKTANTGARVEMSSGGLLGYSATANVFNLDTSGGLYMSGQLDAGTITGGVADFPSPSLANAAGRVHMDDDGFMTTQEGTTNLVFNPSYENGISGAVTFNSATVQNRAPVYQDAQFNVFPIAWFGKKAAKVYDTANANGYVEFPIGNATGLNGLAANGTYTFSFHVAAHRIDDTFVGAAATIYANFANAAIIERKSGGAVVVLASGVDTQYFINNPALGKFTTGLPTGVGIMGQPNWTTRWAKTFTVVSTAATSSTYWVRLPAPCTSGGGIDSVSALCYDGVQVEAKAYATRYCDGDQINCSWNGTRGLSTSTRVNNATAVWFSGSNDPIIRGRLDVGQLRVVDTIKIGSGSPHGTNYWQTTNLSSTQSIAVSTYTVLQWDTTDVTRTALDDGSMWTAPDKFVSQVYGLYSYFAIVTLTANSAGVRLLRFITQGSTILTFAYMTAGINTLSTEGTNVLVGDGYYLQVQVFQNSGIVLNTIAHAAATPNQGVFALVM